MQHSALYRQSHCLLYLGGNLLAACRCQRAAGPPWALVQMGPPRPDALPCSMLETGRRRGVSARVNTCMASALPACEPPLMMLKAGTGRMSFLFPARSDRCLYSGTPFSAAPAWHTSQVVSTHESTVWADCSRGRPKTLPVHGGAPSSAVPARHPGTALTSPLRHLSDMVEATFAHALFCEQLQASCSRASCMHRAACACAPGEPSLLHSPGHTSSVNWWRHEVGLVGC